MKKLVRKIVLACAFVAAGAAFGEVITVPKVEKFPEGEASIADPNLWGGSNLTTNNHVYYYVGDNFRYFLDGSDATLTNLVKSGGLNIGDRNWVAPYTPQVLTIDILNGAHYTLGGTYISYGIEGSHHTLKARSGGVLEFTGAMEAGTGNSKCSVDFQVTDGGMLMTTNARPRCWSNSAGKYGFLIDNATWKTAGWWIGNDGQQAYNDITFAATNAVIESYGWFTNGVGEAYNLGPVFNDDSEFIFGPGTVFKTQGSVVFDSGAHVIFDSATSPRTDEFPGGVWQASSRVSSRPTEIIVKGNSFLQPIGFQVGYNASQTSRVVVAENARVEMTLPSFSYDNEVFGRQGAGFLEVRDNATFTHAAGYTASMPLQFGQETGSYGQCDVYGGLLEYYGYGTMIGKKGTGAYNVYGGEVRHRWIFMNADAGTGTAVFRQTGGIVKVRDDAGKIGGDNGKFDVAHAARQGTVYLEGGELECGFFMASYPDSATVVANGGTLRLAGTYQNVTDKTFIYGIGSFTIGAKGLVLDSNGKDVTVNQNMSNVAGQEGVLTKVGADMMTIKNTVYDVAKTVIAQGGIALGDAATVLDTSLVVTNGATFSMVGGSASVTLRDLVLTNGVIKIDPGDKIAVTGKTALNRLKVAFSSLPTVDQAADFLVCEGELDEGSIQALRRAVFTDTLADGTHGSLTATYDAQTGKTTVKVAVKTNVALTDETVWTGSGNWGKASNWSAGLPDVAKTATFNKQADSTWVTVDANAQAGALKFADNDFTLTGEAAISMPSEEGSLAITVDSGNQTIDVPLKQDASMQLAVASGAVVTVSKAIDGAGFVKTGKGRAELTGDNAFYGAVTVNGGRTSVTSADALGKISDESDNLVNLADGTLKIAGAADKELVMGHDFCVKTSAKTMPTIVETASDVTFAKGLRIGQGCFIKRGAGRLTIPVKDGDVLTMSSDGNDGGSSAHYDYPEDGTPPEKLYVGTTVVEGELLLKGEGVDATSVTMKNKLYCGVKTKVEEGVNPTMALEDVTVGAPSKEWVIGRGCNDVNTEAMKPGLRMTNAKLSLDTLSAGTWAYNASSRPWLAFTNSTVVATWAIKPTTSNSAQSPVTFTAKDSDFFAYDDYEFSGGINMELDHSRLVGKDSAPVTFKCSQYAGNCTLNFRNGTEIAMSKLDFDDYGNNTADKYKFCNWNFSDSTWNLGANSITIDATTAYPGRLHFYTLGTTGVTVNVSTGATLNFANEPLVGAGGLVVTGGGTVAFGNGMLQFTGKMTAENGTIDLTNAGAIENAIIGVGAGTIKGGTFHNATIELDEPDGTVRPTFEGCTFTGMTRVTYASGESRKASGVTIANVSGTLTGIDSFRLKGWDGYRGNFECKDGKIVADIVSSRGFTVIIR